MDNRIDALRAFLDGSHSVYHAQDGVVTQLKKAGYARLMENQTWNLVPGGKYYVSRGGSSVVAFRTPREEAKGFLISASHCDRPAFKLKENFELNGTYTRAAVERYGGMLLFPWLDRPLSVAGRVLVQTPEGVQSRLVDIDRDLLLIPNVAIHMNRQANDGYHWNPAVDTIPLAGSAAAAGRLRQLLEQAAGGRILGQDLYLYVRQKSCVWGIEDEYISGQGLDDLQCVWGCTQGFLRAQERREIPVLGVFDSEEVGSTSAQGAGSTFLGDVLSRISAALGLELHRLLAQSFLISADNAHAIHPNHPELADPAHAPVPGGGIVLKYAASQNYCTDGVCAAVFRLVCERAGVPVQSFCNRPDLRGGSTLGRISLSQVSVPTADIGLAQLAMHSCYETAAVADTFYLEDAMEAFYSACLTLTPDGYAIA